MFTLHDRTRRRICLTGFVLFCLVPTVLVIAWAVAWRTPWHVRAEARRIGRQLGMDVAVGRVEHLRPGAVRLRDVVLRDPEDDRPVLRCPRLVAELQTAKDAAGASRRVLVLGGPAATIDAERLPAIGELVRRSLELRAGNIDVDVWLMVGRIDLESKTTPAQLAKVNGFLRTAENGTQAQIEFGVAGQPSALPVRIGLWRNRQRRPHADSFDLRTGDVSVPCSLVGWAVPAVRSLGKDARFRGYVWAASTDEGWQGEIRTEKSGEPSQRPSELMNVELDRLVTDRFPHTLSGRTRIVVQYASFRSGRIETLSGILQAGPGAVSRSLVDAAATQLGLQIVAGATAPQDVLPYDQLALSFAMDRNGLRLDGLCPGTQRPAVMVVGGRALLESSGRSCPVVALVRAMVPDPSIQAPATPQTNWLARHLPLPEVVPAGAAYGHSRWATGQPATEHR